MPQGFILTFTLFSLLLFFPFIPEPHQLPLQMGKEPRTGLTLIYHFPFLFKHTRNHPTPFSTVSHLVCPTLCLQLSNLSRFSRLNLPPSLVEGPDLTTVWFWHASVWTSAPNRDDYHQACHAGEEQKGAWSWSKMLNCPSNNDTLIQIDTLCM